MSVSETFDFCECGPDYHGSYSIQLIELVNDGFDPFGDDAWNSLDWYLTVQEEADAVKPADGAQKKRFEEKFLRRFRFRDIGITPPGPWRMELTRVAGEVLPKYKKLYRAVETNVDPMSDGSDYGKERRVYSDFPATALNNETEDYAANSNDYQFEHIQLGDFVDSLEGLYKRYNDVDVWLLKEFESLFSCMFNVNANGTW